MRLGSLLDLPAQYWEVPYVAARYPGSVPRGDVHRGANCQLWAYEVLAWFGFAMPDLRSDDLWNDTTSTRHVSKPEALDLVLYSADGNPHGAHVGLWTGHAVAHLCHEVGRPSVWAQSDFDARPRYAVQIGFKRPVRRPR